MAISKSDQIRQLLSEQPELSPSEIKTVLAYRGVEVSRNLCKVVRHREQQSAEQDKPTTERKLRRGETRMGSRVVRLSEEDLAIWDFVERYAKKLENPGFELRVRNGERMRIHRRVRQWLEGVSTRSAKRRRADILDQFIADLARQYPMPESEKPKGRPPIRRRSVAESGTRRRLKKRSAKDEPEE